MPPTLALENAGIINNIYNKNLPMLSKAIEKVWPFELNPTRCSNQKKKKKRG